MIDKTLDELLQGDISDVISIWPTIVKKIQFEFRAAKNEDERAVLLGLHKSVLDMAAGRIAPDHLDKFLATRRSDYLSLLICESADGEGQIPPDVIDRITQREVAAGRMTEDDEFRKLAFAGTALLGSNAAQLRAV